SLRTLRRSPGFVAVSVLSLGLSIGLATTIFGVVDALVYPQYPYRDQSQLYEINFIMPPAMLWNRLRDGGDKAGFARASARMFAARAQADRILKAHPELVESSARFAQSGITISREGTTHDLRTWRVSTN